MSWKNKLRAAAGALGFYLAGAVAWSNALSDLPWTLKLLAGLLLVGTILGSYTLFDRAYEKKLVVRHRPNEAGSVWETRQYEQGLLKNKPYIIVNEPSIIDFTLEEK